MTPAASSEPADAVLVSSGPHAEPRILADVWWRRIVSEPLLHFALLGALLFAGERALARAAEAPVIEVPAGRQREFVKLFEQRQGRAPTDAEKKQLVERYVEDEALFREGVRLSLVHTDPILRAQVIARVRRLLQAELEQKPAAESELRAYYAAHRADYATRESRDAAHGPQLVREAPFEAVRERVLADFRKDRTARAFQAEVTRLSSQWRVQIEASP